MESLILFREHRAGWRHGRRPSAASFLLARRLRALDPLLLCIELQQGSHLGCPVRFTDALTARRSSP